MSKYIQRLGSTKVNILIQMKIVSIEADVEALTHLSLVWSLGSSKEETKIVEMD